MIPFLDFNSKIKKSPKFRQKRHFKALCYVKAFTHLHELKKHVKVSHNPESYAMLDSGRDLIIQSRRS